MATNTQIITREQVIALAMNMPLEKFAKSRPGRKSLGYAYGKAG